MKRIINQVLVIAGLIFLVASCEKAPFVTMTGPRSFTFTQDGGTQSFSFTCNRDWSVSSSEPWIRVSPASGAKGDNEVTVTITCSSNTTYDPRNATITVRVEELTETISVTQETGLGLIVSPTTFDLTNAAQDIEIEVQKNVQYSVTIDEASKSWISQKGTKALSSEKITFSIAANESYDNREGKITFKQTDGDLVQTVTVKQSQTDGLIAKTTEYNVSKEAQTLEIKIDANVPFEVSVENEWIHYVETKALSTSSVVVTIDANESYYSRQGMVVVKSKEAGLESIVSIIQDQTDALFITDEVKDHNVPSAGGLVNVNVFHNIDFEINQALIPDWISLAVEKIDSYNSQLHFTVKKNNAYTGRSVTLSINGKDLSDVVTINQHQVDIVTVDTQELDFTWDGDAIPIQVSSNVDYSIEKPFWIAVESKSETEDGYLKVKTFSIIPEENLDVEREGQITISWNNEGEESITTIEIKQDKWYITIEEAGELINIITNDRLRKMKALTISGKINGTDVLYIRRMEQLRYMNLLNTQIVEGGVSYISIGGETCYTSNDVIGNYMFYASSSFRSLEEVILPSSVTALNFQSFCSQANMTKVVIPESVKIIDRGVFAECYELSDVVLPSHIEVIGDNGFYQCAIKEITIPETVKEIGQHAFSCSKIIVHIKSLPSTLTTIGYLPFGFASNPTIYVPKGYKDEYMLTSIGDYVNVYEE